MTQYLIEIQSAENTELASYLSDRIYEFNAVATGIFDGELLFAAVNDEHGRLIAGLSGRTWGGCCEISQLWIHERHRGKGLGRNLMEAVEREAIRRGCRQVILATHSFQAPGFYEKLGFRKLAVVPDYPEGHQNIHYIKHLRPAGEGATIVLPGD